MSWFSEIDLAPPIEVFSLNRQYNEDPFENKVSLGVGGTFWSKHYCCIFFNLRFLAYRDDNGKPWVLPVVRIAEKVLANDDTLNKEYLPVLGLESFCHAATKMLLGADNAAVSENRVCYFTCM